MLKWVSRNRWYIAIGFCLLLFALAGTQSVCVNKAKTIRLRAEVIADQKKEIYIIYTKLGEAEEIIPVTENEKILSTQLEECVLGFSISLQTIEDLEENTFSLLKQYDNQIKITDNYIAELADERENHQMAHQLIKRLNRELKIARTYNKIYKGVVIGGMAFVIYSVVTK